MTRILTLLSIVSALISAAAFLELMPAHFEVGFGRLTADNQCFGSGQYCEDSDPTTFDLDCIEGPDPACEGPDICARVFYDSPTGNDYWYCACVNLPGDPPDPRNRPSWPCGLVMTMDGGGTVTAVNCINGDTECSGSQSCDDVDNSSACTFCGCK